jgi:hypothetical protein
MCEHPFYPSTAPRAVTSKQDQAIAPVGVPQGAAPQKDLPVVQGELVVAEQQRTGKVVQPVVGGLATHLPFKRERERESVRVRDGVRVRVRVRGKEREREDGRGREKMKTRESRRRRERDESERVIIKGVKGNNTLYLGCISL